MDREGLVYPVGTEETGLRPDSWTGGNAATLFDSDKASKRTIGKVMGKGSRGMVLSSEALLSKLSKEEQIRNRLYETVVRLGFSDVRILVYVRDPMQSGVSYWLQKVKRHGNTLDLDDFLVETRFVQERMAMTAELLELLSKRKGFSINAFNYASCKSDILSSVCRWLEVDRVILSTPPVQRVNRSLDPGEARLQLELNRVLGPYARFLGKALTERITDIDPEKPSPSQGVQESIWEEVKPYLERINRFLPEGEGLVFDRMTSSGESGSYRFTEEQIRVIAETLGGEIKRHWESETKIMSIVRRVKGYIKEKK